MPLKIKNELNQQHGRYIADCWGQSFVFSLTCNKKSKIIRKSQAFYVCKTFGTISFGNCFKICDKANVIPHSWIYFRNTDYEAFHYDT